MPRHGFQCVDDGRAEVIPAQIVAGFDCVPGDGIQHPAAFRGKLVLHASVSYDFEGVSGLARQGILTHIGRRQ